MNQKTKYLTTLTCGRGSKWYMGYGSVLLRQGGVWIQSPNQRLPYKLVDRWMKKNPFFQQLPEPEAGPNLLTYMGVFDLAFVSKLLRNEAAQTQNPYVILIPY